MSRYKELDGSYVVGKTIGSGGFAKVKEGTHVMTGNRVAIKVMDKAALGKDVVRVEREITAMKLLQHQHICQLFQAIETHERFFLILEYCPNGELFDLIISKERLEEGQARMFFSQILSALAYMHHCGFAHRDLKPENLLLDEKQNIKLIDFGLCSQPLGGMDTHIQTCCGSPAYAAPELLSGKMYLGREADIWSLGVLLYTLLCGCLPFDHKNTNVLFKKIRAGVYSFPSWLEMGSRSLISRMLQVEPSRRIRMDELVGHPWVTGCSGVPVSWMSTVKTNVVDHECLQVLRSYFNKPSEELRRCVRSGSDAFIAGTYLLLLSMKRQGKPLRFKIYQDVKAIRYENNGSGCKEASNNVLTNRMCNVNEKIIKMNNIVNNKIELDKENVFKIPLIDENIYIGVDNGDGGSRVAKVSRDEKEENIFEKKTRLTKLLNSQNNGTILDDVHKKRLKTDEVNSTKDNVRDREMVGGTNRIYHLNRKLQQIDNLYNNQQKPPTPQGNLGVNGTHRVNFDAMKGKHHYYETPAKKTTNFFHPRSEPHQLRKPSAFNDRVRIDLCSIEAFDKNFASKERQNTEVQRNVVEKNANVGDYGNIELLALPLKKHKLPEKDQLDHGKNLGAGDKLADCQFRIENLERNINHYEKLNEQEFSKANENRLLMDYLVKSREKKVLLSEKDKPNVFLSQITSAKKRVSDDGVRDKLEQIVNYDENMYISCTKKEDDDDVFSSEKTRCIDKRFVGKKPFVFETEFSCKDDKENALNGEKNDGDVTRQEDGVLNEEDAQIKTLLQRGPDDDNTQETETKIENTIDKTMKYIDDGTEFELKRMSCQSPGKKLTRWRNNQRRPRPPSNNEVCKVDTAAARKVCFSDNTETIGAGAHGKERDLEKLRREVSLERDDHGEVEEKDSPLKRLTKVNKCQAIADWLNNETGNQQLCGNTPTAFFTTYTSVLTTTRNITTDDSRHIDGSHEADEAARRSRHKSRLRNRDDFLRSPVKIDKKQKLMGLDGQDCVSSEARNHLQSTLSPSTFKSPDEPDYENLLRCNAQRNKERRGSNPTAPLNRSDESVFRNTVHCSAYATASTSPMILAKSYEGDLNDASADKPPITCSLSASVDGDLDAPAENSFERNSNRFSKKIVKGVDRLVCMLTPRKNRSASKEPKKIRSTHNVFISDLEDGEVVMERLKAALTEKKISFKNSGAMTLKCTVLDRCNQPVVAFYLEVVQVRHGAVGVLRKRLQGDAWYYKRLCEAVFKAAHLRPS